MKNYNGICKLVSENLSNLGGRMGTEYTTTNFRKFFKDVNSAKLYAEKDYENSIKWKGTKTGFTSGDLMYVMYSIDKINFE